MVDGASFLSLRVSGVLDCCLTDFFSQFILLKFISRNSPSLLFLSGLTIQSFIRSFLPFGYNTDLTFMRISSYIFADLYYNNFYAQLSYKLQAADVPFSSPFSLVFLPLFYPFPSLLPSALWTLCIYANVKGKILSLISNSLITFEAAAASHSRSLTWKSANINFS